MERLTERDEFGNADIIGVDSADLQLNMVLEPPDIRCRCAKEDNLCMALCDRPKTGICEYRLRNDGHDLGKTVFLTREAAEAALKERGSEP